MKNMPHDQVYCRLRPSPLHGVGVFAIRKIPAGLCPFADDEGEFIKVPKSALEGMEPELRRLYEDFCVFEGDTVWCPTSFNLITPSYFLNESKTPNMRCGDDDNFYALRDIEPGEELTVDYDTYSDRVENLP
jgi:hypothetical protein